MTDCANSEASKRGPTYTKMIFKELVSESLTSTGKVSVVGVGAVGMATAFSLLSMEICSEVCLLDARKDIVLGEQLDLQQGLAFYRKKVTILADSDYAASANSKICILTAGVRQAPDEPKLDVVSKNINIFKSIIPNILKYSPETILVVVTNPCDVMAWAAWKISGLPKHKVIGIGTLLDSNRFKSLISERLGVSPRNVTSYIIGEQGEASVPVWSSVSIAGTRLRDLTPTAGDNADRDPENWDAIYKKVVAASYEIQKMKGFSNWGIGLSVSRLCECILKDSREIYTVSTQPDGWCGIYEEVFISLPCIVGANGVTHITNMTLDPFEQRSVLESSKTLRRVLDGIRF